MLDPFVTLFNVHQGYTGLDRKLLFTRVGGHTKNSDLRLELTSLMILRTITSSNLAYLVDSRSASFGGMINKDYDNCDVSF